MESRANEQQEVELNQAELQASHRKNSIRSVVAVTVVMIIIFSVGLRAYIMAKNSSSGAFWPAVPMLLAITFSSTGLSLKSMGKPLLIASIVVLCAAVIMCLIAAITDGIAAENIHHTDFSLCHYSTRNDYAPPCIANESLRYTSYPKRYCLCCYQWSNSYISQSWSNVDGCDDISVTFQNLLWTSMTFNIFGIVTCVIACSFLGGYVSVLNSDSKRRGFAMPPNYVHQAFPGQPIMMGQQNLQNMSGQYPVTPIVAAASPMGDFRTRPNSRPSAH